MTAPKRTPEKTYWHHPFCEALKPRASVRDACKAVGVGRTTAYEHREKFPEFAKAWDDAKEDAVDNLEDIAHERATRITEPSDTLLIFLLKANRPEKYRDRFDVNHSGAVQLTVSPLEDWEKKNGNGSGTGKIQTASRRALTG